MTSSTTTVAPPSSWPTLRVAALRLTLIAGVLGFCADALFVNQALGVNFPLFAVWSLAALFALAGLEHLRPAWRNVWLAAPLVFFATMVAVRAEPWLTFLNVCAALGLGLLLVYLFTSGRLVTFGLWDYVTAAIITPFEVGLIRPIAVLIAAGSESAQPGRPSQQTWAIGRGLLIAAPIIVFFTALLASADAAFNQSVFDALKFLRLDNVPELILRLFVSGVMGWIAAGGLAYALRDQAVTAGEAAADAPGGGRLGFTEAAIVLASVNALFAVFVAVQFRYFFGGHGNITVAGYTYAEYARRGFAELVVVAVCALGLMLLLQSATRRGSAAARWGFNLLCVLLAALTGVLLASAFQRLLLYEEAYGFTRLRTYPHVFMVWVGVLLFVFLATTLLNRPRLFVFGALLSALGFLATLNGMNVDAFIAQQNIARQRASGKLDAMYLATLSDDAIAEVLPLLDSPDAETRATIGSALHYRLNELDALAKDGGWPGWHWSRANAHALLSARRASLERYPPEQYYWRVPID
jgi:hypothetical protein